MSGLWKVLAEAVTFTSDMGVEMRVSDLSVDHGKPYFIMPNFLASREGKAPPSPEFDAGEDRESGIWQCSGLVLFVNALPICGANRLVHNIVKESASGIFHYHDFFRQLQVVEQLLGDG